MPIGRLCLPHLQRPVLDSAIYLLHLHSISQAPLTPALQKEL